MTDSPTHEDFQPHVGKLFHFEGWHGTLTLASVNVLPGRNRPGTDHPPFILIFHGPRGDVLPDGLYRASAGDAVPGFLFYILPFHTTARDRQDYQAVFD